MLEYHASGTIGDVYTHVCRLYHKAKTHKIRVHHSTRHHFWNGIIQRIYFLLPNVGVAFDSGSKNSVGIQKLPMEFFPDFAFADARIHFGIPQEYVAICMKSGRPSQGFRRIKPAYMDEIISNNRNVVLIGDDTPDPYKNPNIIDLRGKTTIWEAFWICKHSMEFYGFQGVMTFVALSQKVPTTVYIAKDTDKVAVEGNILRTPWKQYCKAVIE